MNCFPQPRAARTARSSGTARSDAPSGARDLLGLVLGVALCAQAGTAAASDYVRRNTGDYVAHCSALLSTELPRASLARYGLSADPELGILACSVEEGENPERVNNVRADISARVIGRAGERRQIEFREILSGDLVSYLATYPAAGDQPLDFLVELRPVGSSVDIALVMNAVTPDR